MDKTNIDKILGTYTLEEILEMNDIPEEDVLSLLISAYHREVELPVLPVDL